MYTAFKRRWWKDNPQWPDGLEPDATGRKTYLGQFYNEDEAREFCQHWNKDHNPGRYSVKAEFTEGGI